MRNLFFIFILFIAGCVSQEAMFKDAVKVNTVKAYEDFLRVFPNGEFSKEAASKLETAAFDKAKKRDDVQSYNKFIADYPQSRLVAEAQMLAAFKEAEKADTLEAYKEFLKNYAQSPFKNEVNALIAFKEAENKGTPEAYEEFSKKYPENDLNREIYAYIAFQKAKKSDTLTGYDEFLKKYPSSRCVPHAKERIALIEYRKAKKADSADAYQTFLNNYPDSEYAEKARENLELLNPDKDFSPDKFFLFRLKKPGSPDTDRWLQAYKKYYYDEAQSKHRDFQGYAKYTTLAYGSQHLPAICDELFEEKPRYGFDSNVNFVLFDEYCRRYPGGEFANKVTPEKILKNEIGYLKEIYLSAPVTRIIKVAREKGLSEDKLSDIANLEKEILAFEALDIRDEKGCETFISEYPRCPQIDLIRECLFAPLNDQFWSENDPKLVPRLIRWVPGKQTEDFYTRVWNHLETRIKGKSPEKQLEILSPWLLAPTYRCQSIREKIFLTDLLSKASCLHFKTRNFQNASISSLTASAVIHSSFFNLSGLLFSALPDLRSMGQFEQIMEERKRKIETGKANIRNGRKLLYDIGLAFYSENFLTQLSRVQSETEEDKEKMLEAVKAEMMKLSAARDDYQESCLQHLDNMLEYDSDAWPVLRALTVFPDKRLLESVVLMPRFYDYENNIEEYLDNFKEASVELANQWLSDPEADEMKKSRALYILGYHKTSVPESVSVQKADTGEYSYFYDYYCLRSGCPNPDEYRSDLIDKASEKNRIALVLYNKVAGEAATPPKLTEWLREEIEIKKYDDNEVLHIFEPVIRNLSSNEKTVFIDNMYKSYNFGWHDIASKYYAEEIPENISEQAVISVLKSDMPWKKVALIQTLTKKHGSKYQGFIEGFLRGNDYTEGDCNLIRRNLENMFTKDITVGYNQQINWGVINDAVDKTELRYKAMLISNAAAGLDILPFDLATDVIKDRFLIDKFLCIQGAKWILTHYDPQKNVRPDFSLSNISLSGVKEAVHLLLSAYFSDTPDYTKFTDAVSSLKTDEQWESLVSLGAKYAASDVFKESQGTYDIVNPVADISMGDLLANIRSRFLLLLNESKR